jgi:pentatricopeptide repeat protein
MEAGGIQPDKITFSSILRACQSAEALEEGRRIHRQIAMSAMHMDEVVGNALIDMYVKCGSVSEARQVFDEWPSRDVVMWGTMIAGYVSHALCIAALELFSCMLQGRSNPDNVVFACVLKACGTIGIWAHGKRIHHQIVEAGMESDTVVATSLIDMYGKLGRIEEAAKVFHSSSSCSCVESWSAMMAGFAKQGNHGEVQRYMDNLQLSGSKPDQQTYTSFLVGCSHAAKVSEGAWHLRSMSESHGIVPGIEHFTCMIDLFGRAGRLDEAEKLLNSVPSSMAIARWMSLLTACRTFGNSRLAKLCCSRLVELDPDGAAGYMAMLSISAHEIADESVNQWTGAMDNDAVGDEGGHLRSMQNAVECMEDDASGLDCSIPDSMATQKCKNPFDEYNGCNGESYG